MLLASFLIATALLLLTSSGKTAGDVIIKYFHELAMAVLVALPILVTIELVNQRRHAARAQDEMREQAISFIKRDLPASIWNAIEDGVIKCNFFREDHRAAYTLMLDTTRARPLVVVRAVHRFTLKCGKEPSRRFGYRPEIMFAQEGSDLASFVSLRCGSKAFSKETLLQMTKRRNGHLLLDEVPIDVPDAGVQIELEVMPAYAVDQAFEGVVAVVPTTSLRIDVEAPEGFQVMLDALHQVDMVQEAPKPPYRYTWVQNQGLVQGQGALIRWEIDPTLL